MLGACLWGFRLTFSEGCCPKILRNRRNSSLREGWQSWPVRSSVGGCPLLGGWGNLELPTRALDVITGLLSEASGPGAAPSGGAAREAKPAGGCEGLCGHLSDSWGGDWTPHAGRSTAPSWQVPSDSWGTNLAFSCKWTLSQSTFLYCLWRVCTKVILIWILTPVKQLGRVVC